MIRTLPLLLAAWGFLSGIATVATAEETLTMDRAVALALKANDPSATRFKQQGDALAEQAIAESQLPDPKLSLDMANWPVDSFSYTQEPMTQVKIGIQQSVPRGKTLSYNREKREAEARAEYEKYNLQTRNIILDVRQAWLELYYWRKAREQVEKSREEIKELIAVIESVYVTGRQTSQDLLRAELELSILDDRLIDVDRQIDMTKADLARLIGGEAASLPLADHLPVLLFPSEKEVIRDKLTQHPAVKVDDAIITARTKAINIAEEQYKPGWTVRAGYGFRGNERSDFASLGVTMDVPLFTANRQDKALSAAKLKRHAARLSRDEKLLELYKFLERTYSDWKGLEDRIKLYKKVVINRADETSLASLDAYRNRVADFPELIRSRLAVLDAELTLIRLQTNYLQAQSRLLFLEGEYNE
ncbi:TolC family protein [Luteithermobacter gelatinilyticus]|uniref:TolC family protein n=1 Tax=Luteithermobacter gelatinilyticus TaxID=2582913 RepID=UPI001105D0E0|nr:TolC family protein [Luteithermobacter gelatinilyticus]